MPENDNAISGFKQQRLAYSAPIEGDIQVSIIYKQCQDKKKNDMVAPRKSTHKQHYNRR